MGFDGQTRQIGLGVPLHPSDDAMTVQSEKKTLFYSGGFRTSTKLTVLYLFFRIVQESFQLQIGFSFPFLRANDLRSPLLNIRARGFLLSCM